MNHSETNIKTLKEQLLGKMFCEKLHGDITHFFVPFDVKDVCSYEHGFTILNHSLKLYNTNDKSNCKHTDYYGYCEMDIPLDKKLEDYSFEELLKKVMSIIEPATPERIASLEKMVNDNYKVAMDFIKNNKTEST